MKIVDKFVVVPFRLAKGRPQMALMRETGSASAAVRLADTMAHRYAGVAAFEVRVDLEDEAGEMREPRLLVAHGKLPDLDELLQGAA